MVDAPFSVSMQYSAVFKINEAVVLKHSVQQFVSTVNTVQRARLRQSSIGNARSAQFVHGRFLYARRWYMLLSLYLCSTVFINNEAVVMNHSVQ